MCVKKIKLGSNLTSISLLSSIAFHLIPYACFEHPLCSSIIMGSIQSSWWFKPLALWPHDAIKIWENLWKSLLSLRLNICENLRVWERSLIPVPLGVYLDLLEVGSWLRKSWAKFKVEKGLRGAPDDAPDSPAERPVQWVCWIVLTERRNSVPAASDEVRPVLSQAFHRAPDAKASIRWPSSGAWSN